MENSICKLGLLNQTFLFFFGVDVLLGALFSSPNSLRRVGLGWTTPVLISCCSLCWFAPVVSSCCSTMFAALRSIRSVLVKGRPVMTAENTNKINKPQNSWYHTLIIFNDIQNNTFIGACVLMMVWQDRYFYVIIIIIIIIINSLSVYYY